jgi:uncharacterized integral membrane protein
MKYVWRLFGIVAAIILVVFAVANRETIPVSLWPLPWDVAVPIYVLVLAALALGVLAGGIGAWRAGGRRRRAARAAARRADALSEENEALRHAAPRAAATVPATRR